MKEQDLFSDFLPSIDAVVESAVVVSEPEKSDAESKEIATAPAAPAEQPAEKDIGRLLYGENLFGDSAEVMAGGALSEKFTFPPFSVLNAREGDWQKRKRAWINVGIRSELGRAAPPGGSLMPCANYDEAKKDGGSTRPDGHARRLMATTTVCATEWMKRGPDAGGSIFDPVLAELCYKWFCPPGGQIVDPFAGGSVRGIVAGLLGFRYFGIDLRQEQIDANIEQRDSILGPCLPGMESENSVRWECGDSNVLLPTAPMADFIFSCPPYGDLEQYSDDPADISSMPHEKFLDVYRQIIAKSLERLKPDRMACFVVGDFRDKKTGNYRGFVADTIQAFRDCGAFLYNDAILITAVGSLPVRISGQFEGSRKLGKTHQNVLVFAKGNPKKAFSRNGEEG